MFENSKCNWKIMKIWWNASRTGDQPARYWPSMRYSHAWRGPPTHEANSNKIRFPKASIPHGSSLTWTTKTSRYISSSLWSPSPCGPSVFLGSSDPVFLSPSAGGHGDEQSRVLRAARLETNPTAQRGWPLLNETHSDTLAYPFVICTVTNCDGANCIPSLSSVPRFLGVLGTSRPFSWSSMVLSSSAGAGTSLVPQTASFHMIFSLLAFFHRAHRQSLFNRSNIFPLKIWQIL